MLGFCSKIAGHHQIANTSDHFLEYDNSLEFSVRNLFLLQKTVILWKRSFFRVVYERSSSKFKENTVVAKVLDNAHIRGDMRIKYPSSAVKSALGDMIMKVA